MLLRALELRRSQYQSAVTPEQERASIIHHRARAEAELEAEAAVRAKAAAVAAKEDAARAKQRREDEQHAAVLKKRVEADKLRRIEEARYVI